MWKDVPERRNTDMEIGKKLKDARMKSGFTQEAVAEKIKYVQTDYFKLGK